MNIYVKPTENCNLKCSHCYNDKFNVIDNSRLDIEKALSFVKNIINEKEENWVIIHGGEPLLMNDDQLSSFLNSDIKKYLKIRITTNLTLELNDKQKKLLDYMDEIRTSFDAGINRFGNIKNLLRWKRNVLNNKIKVINFCLTKQLLKHNPKHILKLAAKIKAPIIAFENLCLTGRLKTKEIIPAAEEIDKWLCELYKYNKYNNYNIKVLNFINIHSGIVGDWENYRGTSCCKKTITINANETIGGCPNSSRCEIYGTLDDPIDKIKNNKNNYLNLINKPKNKCLNCEYYKQCRGGCPQQTWYESCPYPKLLSELIKNDLK